MFEDEPKFSEKIHCAYFIGFLYNRPRDRKLSFSDLKEIKEEIGMALYPSINNSERIKIKRNIFSNKSCCRYIRIWHHISNGMHSYFFNPIIRTTEKVKLEEFVIYAFFKGVTFWYPTNLDNDYLEKMEDDFFKKIIKEFCSNSDRERIDDLRWYLNHTRKINEMIERIGMKTCKRFTWTQGHYKDKVPSNEEERMLRNFQEKYR